MGSKDNTFGVFGKNMVDGGEGGENTLIGGDFVVLERNVEIDAD